jgi:hypothetical protein
MAQVKICVWYDVHGTILAIGRPMGDTKCLPLSGENQFLLETEVAEDHIAELHQTHVVDVSQYALVPRRGENETVVLRAPEEFQRTMQNLDTESLATILQSILNESVNETKINDVILKGGSVKVSSPVGAESWNKTVWKRNGPI